MQRPRRDWLKYEVIEGKVWGRGSNFRSVIVHRLEAGFKLHGPPYFYHRKGVLFGVQAVIDLQGISERDFNDAFNEQDNRPVRQPSGLPPAKVAAAESEAELLHPVQRLRSARSKIHR